MGKLDETKQQTTMMIVVQCFCADRYNGVCRKEKQGKGNKNNKLFDLQTRQKRLFQQNKKNVVKTLSSKPSRDCQRPRLNFRLEKLPNI